MGGCWRLVASDALGSHHCHATVVIDRQLLAHPSTANELDHTLSLLHRMLTPPLLLTLPLAESLRRRRYEDAIEMLEKAAAQYKMNKNW